MTPMNAMVSYACYYPIGLQMKDLGHSEKRNELGLVAELADALDLGFSGETRGSSNLLKPIKYARVVKLENTPGLRSGGKPCRFDPGLEQETSSAIREQRMGVK
jgi:hypothetical protein